MTSSNGMIKNLPRGKKYEVQNEKNPFYIKAISLNMLAFLPDQYLTNKPYILKLAARKEFIYWFTIYELLYCDSGPISEHLHKGEIPLTS